jgi:predicted RNA-binding protein (virulence factor B family)
MKAGQSIEAKMLRIEPDSIVLALPDGGEIRVKPGLKHPFISGKTRLVYISRRDEEGLLWGSFDPPPLSLGEVDFLPVHSVSRAGVFFDWAQDRPLFCPSHLVVGTLRPGMLAAVRLVEDERSDRLMASMLWKKDLQPAGEEEYSRGREVEILVMEPHELGYLVLVDQWHQGIIYSNQIFRPVRSGEKMKAWVNALRPDGKLDILLRKPGYGEVPDASEIILKKIREAGGRLQLGDKSPADEVYRVLGMSKKVFKKALGGLYKSGRAGMNETACWETDDVDD